jgi:magnesium-protoporphyrin O-methyltransferase
METASYIRRRDEIETYFDRTAIDAWKRLTSDEPVSGIRSTVRAGRERMRLTLLSYLPDDLSGWRILDAGCGSGVMAVELARRGADVLGVDLSPEMIRHASEDLPRIDGTGRVTLVAGDMLSPAHGEFDAVVSMDALIHYSEPHARDALSNLAQRTRRSLVFTLAPRTLPLMLMLSVGKVLPRSDRSPRIHPANSARLVRDLLRSPEMLDWRGGQINRISSGFYTSEAVEVIRS